MSAHDPKRYWRGFQDCCFISYDSHPSLGVSMKRREFLSVVGGAAVWPLALRAQQAMPIIGVLGIFPLDTPNSVPMSGLRKGLAQTGFVEGRDVAIEIRWTSGMQQDRLIAFASELVRRRASVLVATRSAGVAQVAKKASATTPIVFANGSDPVRVGLVATINRPEATRPA